MRVSGKANLDGNADLLFIMSGSGSAEDTYLYTFMRGWKIYGLLDYKEITDFTAPDLDIYVIKDIPESFEEEMWKNGITLPEGFDIRTALNESLKAGDFRPLLGFANAASALTKGESSLTIDLNKAVYNFVNDLFKVVNGLTAETTIGDILNNENLKKYADALTKDFDYDDIAEAIAEINKNLGDSAEGAELFAKVSKLFENVKPDRNSTGYEYFIKILASEEFLDFLNGILHDGGFPAGVGLTKKLTEFTIGEIFTTLHLDVSKLDEIKTSFAELLKNVTESSVSFKNNAVKNAKITIGYDKDFSLSSIEISVGIKNGDEEYVSAFKFGFVKEAFTLAVLPETLPTNPSYTPEPDPTDYVDVEGKTFVYDSIVWAEFEDEPEEIKNIVLEESKSTSFEFITAEACIYRCTDNVLGEINMTCSYVVKDGGYLYLYETPGDVLYNRHFLVLRLTETGIKQYMMASDTAYTLFLPQ